MIRPITPEDTAALVRLTADTGMFKPLEIRALQEVFADYFKENMSLGHRAFLLEEAHQFLGFAYYADAAMAENTWYLYWIAISVDHQGKGHGAQLLKWVEEDVSMHEGRVLFIETSALPHYAPTRRFYLKQGYTIEGTLRDWYADGDDLVVFRKRLAGADTPR